MKRWMLGGPSFGWFNFVTSSNHTSSWEFLAIFACIIYCNSWNHHRYFFSVSEDPSFPSFSLIPSGGTSRPSALMRQKQLLYRAVISLAAVGNPGATSNLLFCIIQVRLYTGGVQKRLSHDDGRESCFHQKLWFNRGSYWTIRTP